MPRQHKSRTKRLSKRRKILWWKEGGQEHCVKTREVPSTWQKKSDTAERKSGEHRTRNKNKSLLKDVLTITWGWKLYKASLFWLKARLPIYTILERKKNLCCQKNTKQEAYICIKQGKLQRERGTTVICPTKNLQYVHTAQNRGKKKSLRCNRQGKETVKCYV